MVDILFVTFEIEVMEKWCDKIQSFCCLTFLNYFRIYFLIEIVLLAI